MVPLYSKGSAVGAVYSVAAVSLRAPKGAPPVVPVTVKAVPVYSVASVAAVSRVAYSIASTVYDSLAATVAAFPPLVAPVYSVSVFPLVAFQATFLVTFKLLKVEQMRGLMILM